MMAEPARGCADGEKSPAVPPARKPDPRASGWAAARRAMIAAAESNALAVTGLARDPRDAAALEMARLTIRVLENLGDVLRDLTFGEAILEAECERAYAAGVAACKAARCRLEVIDGG
jgi:hypothetical protein